MKTPHAKQQSNPFSTGGGGASYEIRVQSLFVLYLLLGRSAPAYPNSTIDEIALQTHCEGYNIDDILVSLHDSHGVSHRILGQIKHEISFTNSDKQFCESIAAAWRDYSNEKLFCRNTDIIAFITATISATDRNNTKVILDWARYANTAADFFSKVALASFSNDVKRSKLKLIREKVDETNLSPVDDEELWCFLKHLFLLVYDLDNYDGPICSWLNDDAPTSFADIIAYVQDQDQCAGKINRNNIPLCISQTTASAKCQSACDDIQKLNEHSAMIINSIPTDICGMQIDRSDAIANIELHLKETDVVFITGQRGCGKSAAAKLYQQKSSNAYVLAFRAEEFDVPSLSHVLANIGIHSTLSDITRHFALTDNKIILIESLEKILEVSNAIAFIDMLNLAKSYGWKILATMRDYATERVIFNCFSVPDMSHSRVLVAEFNDSELESIKREVPSLLPVIENENMGTLAHNPFYLFMCYRAIQLGGVINLDDTLRSIKNTLWSVIIANDACTRNGCNLKRSSAFTDICVKRAKQLRYAIEIDSCDESIISLLANDDLIRITDNGLAVVSHDILEDWALCKHIGKLFELHKDTPTVFYTKLGMEPAMNRAFRIWLSEKINDEPENVSNTIGFIRRSCVPSVEKRWRDEIFAAIIQCTAFERYLLLLEDILISNDNSLLIELCFIVRLVANIPDRVVVTQVPGLTQLDYQLTLRPHGVCWDILLKYMNNCFEQLSPNQYRQYTTFLNAWCKCINIFESLPQSAENAGLLALKLLHKKHEKYYCRDVDNILFEVITKSYPLIKSQVMAFLNTRSQSDSIHTTVERFIDYITTSGDSMFMAKYDSELIILLMRERVIVQEEEKKTHLFSDSLSTDEFYGFNSYRCNAFRYPNPVAFPFLGLFRYSPTKALRFCVELCNYATAKFLDSIRQGKNYQSGSIEYAYCELTLNNGKTTKQFACSDFWTSYRGMGRTPNILKALLMSFEKWLIELLESDVENKQVLITWVFEYVLRNSNSVLPTAVLASVSVGFMSFVGTTALPLLHSAKLYELDLERSTRERIDVSFNRMPPNEPMAVFINKEIDDNNAKEWRLKNLEDLCIYLQLIEKVESIPEIIDRIEESNKNNIAWKFTRKRIDSRGFTYEYSPERNGIIVTSGEPTDEMRKIIADNNEQNKLANRCLELTVWANKGWDGKEKAQYDVAERLQEIRDLIELKFNSACEDMRMLFTDALPKAVAVIVRDSFDRLSDDDKRWCVAYVLDIIKTAEAESAFYMLDDRIDNTGAAVCAYVLSSLIANPTISEYQNQLLRGLIVGITHPRVSVQKSAANGIREILWKNNSELAAKMLRSKLLFSVQKASNESLWMKYNGFKQAEHRKAAYSKWLKKTRKTLLSTDALVIAKDNIDFDMLSAFDTAIALKMCGVHTTSDCSSIVLKLLYRWLSIEATKKDSNEPIFHEYYAFVTECPRWLAEYVYSKGELSVDFLQPLISACNSSPGFVHSFLLYLECTSEQNNEMNLYWSIWQELSSTMCDIAIELSSLEHYELDDRTILVQYYMHAHAQWTQIDFEKRYICFGKKQLVDFANKTSANITVFEGMAQLMFYFPDTFITEGILVLSSTKDADIKRVLLSSRSATYHLSRAMHWYITGSCEKTMESKYYFACLKLLDALVEAASCEAYFTRDYLLHSKRLE